MLDPGKTRGSVLFRAVHGDFEDFVRIYVPFVYGLARGLSLDDNAARDVAQEALLDLIRQMPDFQYDPKRQFRHFIRRIVHRRKVDYFRKRREASLETVARRRGLEPEEIEELSDRNAAQSISEDLLDRELQRSFLDVALGQVRTEVYPSTFQAFHMIVVQGKSVDETAAILGQTPSQVCQNKHRVTKKLRSRLEKLRGRFGDDVG